MRVANLQGSISITPPGAKTNIPGNKFSIVATSDDMAGTGVLWLNGGRWLDRQLVPEVYLKEATKTNQYVLADSPVDRWKYGLAFWVNDHGKLWPNLPRDALAASGAGSMQVFVCPSLDLVVTQTPGPWEDNDKGLNQNELLTRTVDAMCG